jgi:hypothetical protein
VPLPTKGGDRWSLALKRRSPELATGCDLVRNWSTPRRPAATLSASGCSWKSPATPTRQCRYAPWELGAPAFEGTLGTRVAVRPFSLVKCLCGGPLRQGGMPGWTDQDRRCPRLRSGHRGPRRARNRARTSQPACRGSPPSPTLGPRAAVRGRDQGVRSRREGRFTDELEGQVGSPGASQPQSLL